MRLSHMHQITMNSRGLGVRVPSHRSLLSHGDIASHVPLSKPKKSTPFGIVCSSYNENDRILARIPSSPAVSLINEDLKPITAPKRIWHAYDFFSLWVGLIVCVATYYMAGGLVEQGMSWTQGIFTVFLANFIVLFPCILSGIAGTRYGIPFSVLARAAFGVRGSILPAILRGVVACGWFAIQTWVGGSALHMATQTLCAGGQWSSSPVVEALGITAVEFGCFAAFWTVQLAIMLKGMEGIRKLESFSAPILIAMTVALLLWAYNAAGGFGPMLSAPSLLATPHQFWSVFIPALTANTSAWATLSLNMSDFTRFAVSQRAQIVGQTLGLPITMTLFTFVGLAVTSATVVIFGRPISDPVALLGELKGVIPVVIALLGVTLATLTTNLAANVVGPCNALTAINPKRFNFSNAAVFLGLTAFLLKPWNLVSSSTAFFNWLIGYSVFIAPVAAIMLVDFHLLRRGRLNIDALYSLSSTARYYYNKGWNPIAVLALVAGIVPTLPGLLNSVSGLPIPLMAAQIYNASWFVGFFVGGLVYFVGMRCWCPKLVFL